LGARRVVMSSSFELDYSEREAPDGVLAFVPPTAIPDGETRGVTPTHRVLWFAVSNTGTNNLRLANSVEALTEGVYWPLSTGEIHSFPALGASRRFVLQAPAGGGAGEFAAVLSLSRQPVGAANPEIEVDEGFPAYDGSDPDNIVPGVDTA
jgi:hypothetical protein